MKSVSPHDFAVLTVLNTYCSIEVNLDNFKAVHDGLYNSDVYLKAWFLDINKELLLKTIETQIDSCHYNLINTCFKKPSIKIKL